MHNIHIRAVIDHFDSLQIIEENNVTFFKRVNVLLLFLTDSFFIFFSRCSFFLQYIYARFKKPPEKTILSKYPQLMIFVLHILDSFLSFTRPSPRTATAQTGVSRSFKIFRGGSPGKERDRGVEGVGGETHPSWQLSVVLAFVYILPHLREESLYFYPLQTLYRYTMHSPTSTLYNILVHVLRLYSLPQCDMSVVARSATNRLSEKFSQP